jgi:hypothetical protein
MTTEDAIKNEMRLFALESVFCHTAAAIYQKMPRQIFEAVHKQTIEGARRQTFPGIDAAYSDYNAVIAKSTRLTRRRHRGRNARQCSFTLPSSVIQYCSRNAAAMRTKTDAQSKAAITQFISAP